MAILHPTLFTIESLPTKPTEWEYYLLNFLNKNLSDEYEIFFNPYINWDRPDIVIYKKSYWVVILEVKDWNLDLYTISDKNTWTVRLGSNKTQEVLSPISQASKYKWNFFNSHSVQLAKSNLLYKYYKENSKQLNPSNYIQEAVYFHNSNTAKINDIKGTLKKMNIWEGNIFAIDSSDIMLEWIKNITEREWFKEMDNKNYEELHNEIYRYLKPIQYIQDIGNPIKLNKKQKELSTSIPWQQKKIKWIAGWWKTTVIWHLALNAAERHKWTVLILCFNRTLKNYIHDKIKQACRNKWFKEYDFSYFHIQHYHQFIKLETNNYSIPRPKSLEWFNQANLFQWVDIKKYKTIIIDEIQDFEKEWIEILRTYFLDETDGEFIVFWDEKQNIYANKTITDTIHNDEEWYSKEISPYTWIDNIEWEKLTTSHRAESNNLKYIIWKFQQEFFLKNKYTIDPIISLKLDLFGKLEEDKVWFSYNYYNIWKFDANEIIKIFEETKKNDNNADICFLWNKIKYLQEIESLLKSLLKLPTLTTFEDKELNEKIKWKIWWDKLDMEINNIRIVKKENFWRNSGKIMLSSIQSFKWWEVNTLFLIITNNNEASDDNSDIETKLVSNWPDIHNRHELWYTALTRCRKHLIVINLWNWEYHKFFEELNNTFNN